MKKTAIIYLFLRLQTQLKDVSIDVVYKMSNRFSDWFNKIVGKAPNDKIVTDVKSVEPDLPHEAQNNANSSKYDAYAEYAALKKKFHVEKAYKQIDAYDAAKQKEDPNYKSMAYNMAHELDEADVDDELDKALDIEQAKKLEVCEEQQISAQRQKELEQQETVFNERRAAHANAVAAIRAKIAQYDAKQNRENYKTYEERCHENDENSDHEEDEEMARVLQERLGVYDATKETEEIKQKRLKKQTALDAKLIIEDQARQERIADIGRKMDNYHEQNKNRKNYQKYDSGSDPAECDQVDAYYVRI